MWTVFACAVANAAKSEDVLINIDNRKVTTFYKTETELWIGTDDGAYRTLVNDGKKLIRVDLEMGEVTTMLQTGRDLWIGARNGLFHWEELWTDPPRHVPTVTSSVTTLFDAGTHLLIGTTDGLYRWLKASTDDPVKVPLSVGHVREIREFGDFIWVETDRSVYQWNRAGLDSRPRRMVVHIEGVSAFHDTFKGKWVGSKNGLFRMYPGSINPMRVRVPITNVTDIQQIGWHLVIAADQLYTWKRFSNEPPAMHQPRTGRVFDLAHTGDMIWISTERGIFRWHQDDQSGPIRIDNANLANECKFHMTADRLWINAGTGGLWQTRIKSNEPPGRVTAIDSKVIDVLPVGRHLWVLARDGLYHADMRQAGQSVGVGRDVPFERVLETTRLNRLEQSESYVWAFGDQGGAVMWPKRSNQVDPQFMDLPDDMAIERVFEEQTIVWLVAAGGKGLVRIRSDGNGWIAGIRIDKETTPAEIYNDEPLTLRWRISDYAYRTNQAFVRQRISVTSKDDPAWSQEIPNDAITVSDDGTFSATLTDLTTPGDFTVQIIARDLLSQTAESSPFHLSVYEPNPLLRWNPQALAPWLTVPYALVGLYVLINIAVFINLVIAAKVSPGAFRLLVHPMSRRLGLFYGWAICRWKFIRMMIFNQYYDDMKAAMNVKDENEFVPTELQRSSDLSINLSVLPHAMLELKQVWLVGGPGSGKSRMIREFGRVYFRAKSFNRAVGKYGFIPVFIDAGKIEAGKSLIQAVRKELASHGYPFPDDQLIERFIDDAKLLIVIDNAPTDYLTGPVRDALIGHPGRCVLATSRTRPADDHTAYFDVSPMTPWRVRQLLRSLHGEHLGLDMARMVGYVFRREATSVYDLQLLAEHFMAGGQTPTNRLDLYHKTAQRVFPLPQSPTSVPWLSGGSLLSESFSTSYGDAGWDIEQVDDSGAVERPESVDVEEMRAITLELAFEEWKSQVAVFDRSNHLTIEQTRYLEEQGVLVREHDRLRFQSDLLRAYFAAMHIIESDRIDAAFDVLQDDAVWNVPANEQDFVFRFLVGIVTDPGTLYRLLEFGMQSPRQRVRLIAAVREAEQTGGMLMTLAM